jgi:hypothetical protein
MLDAKLTKLDRREQPAFADTASARARPAFGFWRAVRVVGGAYFNHLSTFAITSESAAVPPSAALFLWKVILKNFLRIQPP